MSVNRPKQYEVVKRHTRPMKSIKVGDKSYNFGKNDDFIVNDPGVARELMKYHKKDVNVMEVDKPRMSVSNNFFVMPEMPWKKKGKKAKVKKEAKNDPAPQQQPAQPTR